jgi:peptidoglycan hydrolase-like protein with peptidoglycan-binding domain
MDQNLSSTVGSGGSNRDPDVRKVQSLLNGVPSTWGGPAAKLKVDGLMGPLTVNAIRAFQNFQLGTIFTPDGRVDPSGRSLRRLNHINSTSERPGGSISISVEPVAHVTQPTNLVCWAAAGTMLVGARDRQSVAIPTVMRTADNNDAGPGYLNKFNTNQGLAPTLIGRYTQAIGLHVGPQANFSVAGFRSLMSSKGALGIVALTPFLHIRVISEMTGDGTVFGTLVTVHDPGKPQPHKEVFISFAERYEAVAGAGGRMDQIWHR